MPLYTDLNKDFKKVAAEIHEEADKGDHVFQLQELVALINKMLLSANITLRVRMKSEDDDNHISFVQFGRKTPYAKVKIDLKKKEANVTPEGQKAERLTFKEFTERLLRDVFNHLDMDERREFAKVFDTVMKLTGKPKEIAGPTPA